MAVLETLAVVMFIVLATATLQGLPTRSTINPAREPVEQAVADLLQAFKGLPTNDPFRSALTRAIAKGIIGNTTAFDTLILRTMPPGTQCRLTIDNGHAARLVVGPESRLARESVSASAWWRPGMAYTLAAPTLDVIHPAQPMEIQGYAVSRGALVREHGIPLDVKVVTDQGNYTRTTLTSLRAASGPEVSLLLRNETGGPAFIHRDPLIPLGNTTVLTLAGTTSLPTPTDFTVPPDTSYLDVTATFTGNVDYTLTFTSPLGSTYALLAQGSGTFTRTRIILDAPPGTWTFQGNGTISMERTLPSANLTVQAWTTAAVNEWTFVLNETAGKPLAPGTNVTIRFPAEFTGLALTNAAQPGWRNIQAHTDDLSGAYLTAELDTPLQGASRDLVVHAAKPAPSEPLYQVQAWLGNGADARATFILAKPAGLTLPGNPLQHAPYLATARPWSPGQNASMGVVFPYPSLLGLGPIETVKVIDVTTADGRALFASVTGTGWTLRSPSHAQWIGRTAIAPNRAAEFHVQAQPLAGETTVEPALRLPLQFSNGDRFDAGDFARPYVYAASIPPENPLSTRAWGYAQPELAGVPPRGNATYRADWPVRGFLAQGNTTYAVSSFPPLSALQEATRVGLARSQLALSRQEARIGEPFNLSVDFRGLLDQITLVPDVDITGWNVEVSIYDPMQPMLAPTLQDMVPSYRGRFGANGSVDLRVEPPGIRNPLATGFESPSLPVDATSIASATIPFVAPRGAFFGPYAVVAQANFIVNDALGQSILQSARLLGILDVLPDSGQSGGGLYWASMECWLQDW